MQRFEDPVASPEYIRFLNEKCQIIIDYLEFVSKEYTHIGEFFSEMTGDRLFYKDARNPCYEKLNKVQ